MKDFLIWQTEIEVANCNGTSGLSLMIQSSIIKQNVDRNASIFFTLSQIKQFATQKKFRKSNRQYLRNQQTVLSSSDQPCQKVLKFPGFHARQFWIFSAFHSPLGVRQPWSWNFDLFFIEKWFCDTQNTFHLIVRGFKNAFFMPFTHSLFQKYPSYMRVSCAISEISIHYESGLRYFRNIHPLWDEQQ